MHWKHSVRNNNPIAFFQEYNHSQKICFFGLIKYNSFLSEEYGNDYWNACIWKEHCGIRLETIEFPESGHEIWLSSSFDSAKKLIAEQYKKMLTDPAV